MWSSLTFLHEPQLHTNNSCITGIPRVATNCIPLIWDTYFNSPLVCSVSIYHSHTSMTATYCSEMHKQTCNYEAFIPPSMIVFQVQASWIVIQLQLYNMQQAKLLACIIIILLYTYCESQIGRIRKKSPRLLVSILFLHVHILHPTDKRAMKSLFMYTEHPTCVHACKHELTALISQCYLATAIWHNITSVYSCEYNI